MFCEDQPDGKQSSHGKLLFILIWTPKFPLPEAFQNFDVTKTLLFEQTADLIKNISFARKRVIAEAKLSKVNHQRKGQKTLKCQ